MNQSDKIRELEQRIAFLESELQKNEVLHASKFNANLYELNKLEALLSEIFRQSPSIIVLSNFDTGIIIDVTTWFDQITGFSRSEIIGKNINYKGIIKNNTDYSNLLWGLKQSQNNNLFEIEIYTKNGETRKGTITNSIVTVHDAKYNLSFFLDESDKYRYEKIANETINKFKEELNTERNLFNSLMHSSLDVIYFKDKQHRFIKVNNSQEKYAQLSGMQDIIGKTDFDLFTTEHAQQAWDHEEKIMQTGQALNAYEEKETWKNGIITWASSTKMPLFGYNGEIIGIFGISRDITQQKLAEFDLLKAKEMAEESDRLKSTFLANMSHEIRTPMNGIMGFAELLNRPSIDDEKRIKYAKIIKSRSIDLLKLINEILDISKIEAGLMTLYNEQTSLNNIIDDLYIFFNNKKQLVDKSHIEIKTSKHFENNNDLVMIDSSKLNQVLINFIENALKFTSQGYIMFGYKVINNILVFTIEDTGIGIPPEKIDIIFERFRQSDESITRKFGGTGLGLSIAKGIIELMEGKIYVSSELNKGTCFTIEMPYKQTIVNKLQCEPKKTKKLYNWQNKTILIVEDDEASCEYLNAILLPNNINILQANNGIAAYEMVLNNNIDIVLMDIQLPLMNGNDTTRKIKQQYPNLPIIIQTAYAMPDEKQKSLEAGCDQFLTKPVNDVLLLNLINVLLEKTI